MKRTIMIIFIIVIILNMLTLGISAEDYETDEFAEDIYVYFTDISWKPEDTIAVLSGYEGNVYKYSDEKLEIMPTGIEDNLNGVDWKPDGSYALIVGDRGTVIKCDGSTITLVESGGSFYSNYETVRWDPSGTEAIIVGGSYNHGLILRYDGENVEQINLNVRGIEDLEWSPDGSHCLLVGAHGQVYRYEDEDNFETLTEEDEYNRLFGVSWKPDGSSALIVGLSGTILSYDGEVFTKIDSDTDEDLKAVDWKPDGSSALITGMDGSLLMYDGESVTNIYTDSEENNLNEVKWHHSSNYALIVGSGTVTKLSESSSSVEANGSDYFSSSPILFISIIVVVIILVILIILYRAKKKKEMSSLQPDMQNLPSQHSYQNLSGYRHSGSQHLPGSSEYPPSRQQHGVPTCPTCQGTLLYYKQYQKWYCGNCQRYI